MSADLGAAGPDGQGNSLMAVSGGDAPGANPLIPFFGYPLSANQLINPAYNLPHEAVGLSDGQDFADLYKGPSPFMSITLQALIVEADEWPTRVLMPWYHTDKVNIGWQIWKFDRTLADLEPEQGVPRYITTEYEHKSSRMLRRGLAFQLEHGFWSTEEGKLNYAMNIQTIRSAVHETVYQSILHSLLNEGQALTKFYNARYNVANFSLKTALEFEKWRFGIVNKQQHGLELIDAELSKYLSREAVKPDVWVFPPKMKLYCSYATPSSLEVFRSGDALVAENRKASQQILSDSYFAGKQVFESREYAVDFSASPIDQLSRERQTGDYFLFCEGKETLVYDADFDDFMPVDAASVQSVEFNGASNRAAASMPLFASSGSKMTVTPKAAPTEREQMTSAGYNAQQIDQVLNCARCFQLAHLMHSSPAGFAADLKATPVDTFARANITDKNAMNMSVNSDSCVVDAIEGRGDVSPAMRVACSLASGIVAGVPHSMLELRYANIRGCDWYKNLHAAYETAMQMNFTSEGQASDAIRQHAIYNGVDTAFVDWVAANVDNDTKLTQIAITPSGPSTAAAANVDITPLAWGALDALSSNLNVDGLSPVAIASLRSGSASVDGLNMHGDAQSVATTFANVKRHWDAKMSDDYTSSTDSFLGVRRAQAKAASFGHFLSNHVFTKNDEAARLAAGAQHADAAAAANLNFVSAEGAAVWNKLVAATAERQGWPTNTSVPQALNAWKMPSASASLSESGNTTSVSIPLAFRASDVTDVNTQVSNIANLSSKPVTLNDDAWSAVSFPFAGAKAGALKDFYASNQTFWQAVKEEFGIDYKSAGFHESGKAGFEEIQKYYVPETKLKNLKTFKELSDFLASVKKQTFPCAVKSYSYNENTPGEDDIFVQRGLAYTGALGYKIKNEDMQTLMSNSVDAGVKQKIIKTLGITVVSEQENFIRVMIHAFMFTDIPNFTKYGPTIRAQIAAQSAKSETDAIQIQALVKKFRPVFVALYGGSSTLLAASNKGNLRIKGQKRDNALLDSKDLPEIVKITLQTIAGADPIGAVTAALKPVIDLEDGDQPEFLGDSVNPYFVRDSSLAPAGKWYLIERPFKTFRMGTGILAKGGETLGLTFYGHCNFQWSNNTTNKVHEGHFTFYSRPVVRDWRQYAIAEDIFVLGYVRGEVSGCSRDHFIESDKLRDATPQTLHEIYGGQHGHLIVYQLNSEDDDLTKVRRQIANPHSITGSWDAFERQYEGSPAKPLGATNDNHWDSAAYYQSLYKNFYDALKAENSRISGGGFAVAPGCYNTVVWETQYSVAPKGEPSKKETVEPSDCLPHYYRGRAQAISGMSVFLQNPATTSAKIQF